MGGLAWEALPIVIEMFGITNPELFVRELVAIREFQNREK